MIRKQYRAVVIVVMVVTLLTNPFLLAWGNPPPGRWEKVAETKPGDWMTVYMKDGVKQNCRFQLLDDSGSERLLVCADKDDTRIQFNSVNIEKIVAHKSGKYAKNGALFGAAGGAAVFGILITKDSGDLTGAGQLMVISAGAALGALGGILTGTALGAPGEIVYISKELAMKEATK